MHTMHELDSRVRESNLGMGIQPGDKAMRISGSYRIMIFEMARCRGHDALDMGK